MDIIYHVTTRKSWEEAMARGYYLALSLEDEGFIHCSQAHQVAGVLERYFEGQDNLVKLVIDTRKLNCKYVFDWSPSTADTFPHVYGPINLDAVTEVVDL
ncbi:MAG: DUF952 domain-containing protein [Chitinophagaceae bacterium]|nr:DUF952 domain-containing protein [Chitinophagaceae bacterium]MBL0335097.1 DUF952 domain-containing protein [Chitinophagaceae bacterium]